MLDLEACWADCDTLPKAATPSQCLQNQNTQWDFTVCAATVIARKSASQRWEVGEQGRKLWELSNPYPAYELALCRSCGLLCLDCALDCEEEASQWPFKIKSIFWSWVVKKNGCGVCYEWEFHISSVRRRFGYVQTPQRCTFSHVPMSIFQSGCRILSMWSISRVPIGWFLRVESLSYGGQIRVDFFPASPTKRHSVWICYARHDVRCL